MLDWDFCGIVRDNLHIFGSKKRTAGWDISSRSTEMDNDITAFGRYPRDKEWKSRSQDNECPSYV